MHRIRSSLIINNHGPDLNALPIRKRILTSMWILECTMRCPPCQSLLITTIKALDQQDLIRLLLVFKVPTRKAKSAKKVGTKNEHALHKLE
jgi:hypothetical protein